MGCAAVRTISLTGAFGHLVDVEVDVSQGMVMTSMVGRPDAAVTESRERCRAALGNIGLRWPNTQRVTILLSPADLPKRGTQFDLAIAVAVLVASGQVAARDLDGTAFLGELTLTGRLRPLPEALPMVLAAARSGVRRVVVPEPQHAEVAVVPGIDVVGVRSLAQVIALLVGVDAPEAPPVAPSSGVAVLGWRGQGRLADLDLADLDGLAGPRFALEVAAAGGHHLLLTGPKGAGKTSLAERLPGILPDLGLEEALEVTAVRAVSGLRGEGGLLRRPPFVAPHHSASRTSVLGGGTGRVRPGEISRAHAGVAFLDEFPLFPRDIVEALRQPLEAGEVTLSRGDEVATFPARTQFVLAANPCACGGYDADVRKAACTCSNPVRQEYLRRLEGPVVDRIDIRCDVQPALEGTRGAWEEPPESTSEVRARVEAARERQARRFAGRSWRLNAHVPAAALRAEWPLVDGADLLDEALRSGALTRRGAVRVHRLALTVADLAARDRPSSGDVEIALRLRLGQPVPGSAARRAG